MKITYKIPNNYKSNCLKELGLRSWIYCLEMLQKKKKSGKECLKKWRNKDTNVFKNTWSYNSFVGENDIEIQNIIGKDVEPHSYWYWMKSISFHWFINFGFWLFPKELILLIFECRFETFNIFCPLFFPRHYKHEIKNQTRQLDPNFNYLLHSKPPKLFIRLLHHTTNLILSLLSLSLSLSLSLIHLQPILPPSEPTTTIDRPTIHNRHKPQATTSSKSSNMCINILERLDPQITNYQFKLYIKQLMCGTWTKA